MLSHPTIRAASIGQAMLIQFCIGMVDVIVVLMFLAGLFWLLDIRVEWVTQVVGMCK